MKTQRQGLAMERVGGRIRLGGMAGAFLRQVTDHWLKLAPAANPAMIEMLRDRDQAPLRQMVGWAGEFVGKYLTGAVECLRLTGDEALEKVIREVVEELLACQDADGYAGPWPCDCRLSNWVPNGGVWDTWGHYHVMLGLLLWHEEKHDPRALQAATSIGDAICRKYLGEVTPRLVDCGWTEMNLAPAHGLMLLYHRTGEDRYLEMAKQIVREFAAKDSDGAWLAGNWLEGTLAGQEFWQLPRPRWESLHPIMALPELACVTGEARYRAAFERMWESMRAGDRHNNGGWSAGEQAQGNPYHPGAIETCCTIAWMAMTVEMLRLTGRPDVADELEMATLNSGLGLHSPSGKWATYNTPMDGVREASHHSIVFQARAGQSDLNCCSVNAARSLGLASAWAVMKDAEGYILNWYGEGEFAAESREHGRLVLRQQTDYPLGGAVRVSVEEAPAHSVTLKLRIPGWSGTTAVRVNGEAVQDAMPGTYLSLRRPWKAGHRIEIDLDLSLHAWVGERQCRGKASLYRGPILLTWDRRYNGTDPDGIPSLDGEAIELKPARWTHWLPPALLLEARAAGGQAVKLCDFATAGNGGTPYRTWLPLANAGCLRRSPFAPPPAVIAGFTLDQAQAVLGRFREQEKDRPEEALKTLSALQAMAADVREALAAARKPGPGLDAKARRKIRDTLARFGEGDMAKGVWDQALAAMRRRVYARYPDMLQALHVFSATEVGPAVADVRRLPAPARGSVFKPVEDVTGENFADIRQFHRGHHGVVYIRTAFDAAKAAKGELLYGADGPVRVWVNGRAVGCVPGATNPAVAGAHRAAAAWKKGINEIVFGLLTNQGRAWGVFASVRAGKAAKRG